MKELLEKRGLLDTELNALKVKFEAKSLNETEEKRFDEVIGEIETLNEKILQAEKRELAIKEAESRMKPVNIVPKLTKTDNEEQIKNEFRYSKIITDLADRNKIEGFYSEMNQEGRKDMENSGVRLNDTQGFIVPSFLVGNEKRAMTTSTADTPKAGYTVATDLLGSKWVDTLKNSLVTTQMGSVFLSGLKGNIVLPRNTSDPNAEWLTETGTITESDFNHDQIAMSPKRLGNATRFSRQLLIQSSLDIEMLVRKKLVTAQALALQDAAIKGPSIGNSPLGILNTSGIGSVVINTNGGPLTWAAIVALETAVANANALGDNQWYLTNSKVRGAAKGIVRDSGSGLFLWGTNYGGGGENLPLNGYRAAVTNAVPSTNVKGSSGAVCSSLIFGDFSNLVYGQWGGLVLQANPYAYDLSGEIRVVANAYYDIDVLHAEAFAAINDITT